MLPPISVGLIWSQEMELHSPGQKGYIECPQRHAKIVTHFQKDGLFNLCQALTPASVTDEQALRVHSPTHLAKLAGMYKQDGEAVQVDEENSLYCNKFTNAVARLSAGCAVAATLAVARGEVHSAFAVIRPPGHHAQCGRANGFCFLNNASIATLAALEECGDTVKRVVILDWDVHHGDGIQAIHYNDPRVMYISLHRYGDDGGGMFFPGTGKVDDVGDGEGKGYNVNIPWTEKGLSDADYQAAFELVVEPIVKSFGPDLILISAGFDAAKGDPMEQMNLSPNAFHDMTRRLVACQPRCVALLEGGYNVGVTARCAAATLRGLLRQPLEAQPAERLSSCTAAVLREVVSHLKEYWPALDNPLTGEPRLRL